MVLILSALIGYVCGSLNSAIILCKLCKLPDPRNEGSGNPGATNVMRIAGKKLAAITLLFDLLKGLLPVVIFRIFWPDNELAWLLVGLFAFVGHIWPVFFKFKGGKGVATALGVLIAWNWLLALIVLAVWIVVFAMTRISSLSALVAAFSAPWISFLMIDNKQIPIVILAMVGLLIYRHRDNIQRLKSGEESKFKKKKSEQ